MRKLGRQTGGRKRRREPDSMRRIGQTKSGLIKDALVVAAGTAIVAGTVKRRAEVAGR